MVEHGKESKAITTSDKQAKQEEVIELSLETIRSTIQAILHNAKKEVIAEPIKKISEIAGIAVFAIGAATTIGYFFYTHAGLAKSIGYGLFALVLGKSLISKHIKSFKWKMFAPVFSGLILSVIFPYLIKQGDWTNASYCFLLLFLSSTCLTLNTLSFSMDFDKDIMNLVEKIVGSLANLRDISASISAVAKGMAETRADPQKKEATDGSSP